MTFIKYLAAVTATVTLNGMVAGAQDEKAPFVPEGYELTGETRNCLSVIWIDNVHTDNEEGWVFTVRGGQAYMNRVTRGCRSASRGFSYISYRVYGSQICRGEIVQVIDSGTNMHAGGCGLGEFEQLRPVTGVEG